LGEAAEVWVYGDHWRQVSPTRQLALIADLLRSGRTGPERHDELVRALIEAGELAQGLADAEFAHLGCDDDTALQAAALDLATALARKVLASWDSGFSAEGGGVQRELSALAALAPLEMVSCKAPEGYAFYAVYPEVFMAAARGLAGGPPLIIGLRSIGVSLGAAVAAASGVAKLVTVRPHGPPFERSVSVSERLKNRLAAHRGPFAIVDEGPGLSGSSFGAVADLLDGLGVAGDRVTFLPSHAGEPGRMTQARHRARWRESRRLVKVLEDIAEPAAIAGWFSDAIGAVERVEDLSHGGWRKDLPPRVRPPVWAANERLKFRLTARSGVYLAKFAGLGRPGELKLAQARRLNAAGFVAEPVALRHGFLLQRWLPGAPLLGPLPERPAALRRLGDYLRFRRLRLPAEAAGADGARLCEMAYVNAEALAGRPLADLVERRLAPFYALEPRLGPVQVDGRLHRWEWIRGPDGVLGKTDALDHACAHDLIGAQDIGWDLAGAAVEFALDAAETRDLETQVLGRHDPERVDAFRGLYCAFQAGLWSMAADAATGPDGDRADRQRRSYLAALTSWTHARTAG
jgi:hypothetical protein